MPIFKLGSRGTQVMKIQAVLRKIGYNLNTIDGIYGRETEQAVKNFQKNNGLAPDGIIGSNTYRVLRDFILGYNTYIVKPGDTLYNIAQEYKTQVYKITVANPQVHALGLIPEQYLRCLMI